jgi:hypothetical protein
MYNKAAFAAAAQRLGWKSKRKTPQRRAISTQEIISQFIDNGHAIIPMKDLDAVRSRVKRENYRWAFTKLNDREMKVTPKHE